MLRHVLAAALRHLDRHRLTAAINVGALALAFAAALLIATHVRDELSFDRWIPGHERVHRIAMALELGNTQEPASAGTAPPVAGWLMADFPQIEAAGRLRLTRHRIRVAADEADSVIAWTDPELLDVLPLPALRGEARAALAAPDGAVVTAQAARRLFGREEVLGETLTIDGAHDFRIGAVLRDLPAQTHLALEILLSARNGASTLPPRDAPLRFMNQAFDALASAHTYVRLRPGSDPREIDARIEAAMARHVSVPRGPDGRPLVPMPRLYRQALDELHFIPAGANSMRPSGSRELTIALAAIGLLILAIALVNFVNLTLAYADTRAREVAVRRAAGARRAQLVAQFAGEALLVVGLAAVLAISLVELARPVLAGVLGRPLVPLDRDIGWWAAVAGIVLVLSLAGGAWPALVATARRKPAPRSGTRIRRTLVSAQFAILTALLVAVTVVHAQSRYALQTGLRFDAQQLVVVDTDCRGVFVDEVRRLPGVGGAACTDARFGLGGGTGAVTAPAGGTQAISVTFVAAQTGLLELAGLAPLAGRFDLEGSGVVVNETAVRALGYLSAAGAIGRPARFLADGAVPPTIVGVAPDFALQGVLHEIQPIVFHRAPDAYRFAIVRIDGRRVGSTLDAIDAAWTRTGEPGAMHRAFLDDELEHAWRDLQQQKRVLAAFAAVAVTIAAFGLFGLSAQLARRRVREIGVRKALGAHPRHVLWLMLAQFSRPVLWANLLAWPAAAWAMQRWLQGFVYRVELQWWMFASASAIALAIALFAGALHALRAARTRPVVALREAG